MHASYWTDLLEQSNSSWHLAKVAAGSFTTTYQLLSHPDHFKEWMRDTIWTVRMNCRDCFSNEPVGPCMDHLHTAMVANTIINSQSTQLRTHPTLWDVVTASSSSGIHTATLSSQTATAAWLNSYTRSGWCAIQQSFVVTPRTDSHLAAWGAGGELLTHVIQHGHYTEVGANCHISFGCMTRYLYVFWAT